jgi:putative FmdB family regulatory protein
MPIYAYRCADCDHAYDRLQKLSDPDPEACPACGAAAVKRQLTAPSFRLSGSGWYETDFKKDGDKKRNLVEGGEGAGKPDAATGSDKPADKSGATADKPAAKSEGKPDSKPDSKADSKADSKPAPKAEAKASKPAAGDA